MMNEIFNRGPF